MNCFLHKSSYVDEPSSIGKGTKIWHFCHIQKNAIIGRDCILAFGVWIGEEVVVGNNVKIQNNASLNKGVILEDDVFIGPSVVTTNVINPRAFINRKEEMKETLVKKGASIGARATIICGNTLGRYCFVGAGALVERDVKDYVMVIGNPARPVGFVSQEGMRINFKSKKDVVVCPHGKTYKVIDDQWTVKCVETDVDI